MRIIPDYTLANAPAPKVVVIPAQTNDGKPVLEWIRSTAKAADLVMSVCTGAFLLAKTGLLSGKAATTHHGEYATLAEQYPDIHVKRGVRFVDEGNLASSGGLSCGIDLALHVVERYHSSETAKQTAFNMEYQGQGWMHPDANKEYASMGALIDGHPACVVCAMPVDATTALAENYKKQEVLLLLTEPQSGVRGGSRARTRVAVSGRTRRVATSYRLGVGFQTARSLTPQHFHRIDPAGTVGRHVRRSETDGQQHGSGERERDGIDCTDAEQLGGQDTPGNQCHRNPDCRSRA
jgi:hypothetical protein